MYPKSRRNKHNETKTKHTRDSDPLLERLVLASYKSKKRSNLGGREGGRGLRRRTRNHEEPMVEKASTKPWGRTMETEPKMDKHCTQTESRCNRTTPLVLTEPQRQLSKEEPGHLRAEVEPYGAVGVERRSTAESSQVRGAG